MKNFASFETGFAGGDGKLTGAVGADKENLVIEVKGAYPLKKVVEPATKALDNILDKLEKAIPGDWDKPIIEKFKEEYKSDLVKLIAEKAAE